MASSKASSSATPYSAISSSSFIDLKAEITKKQSDFTKSRGSDSASYTVGTKKRPSQSDNDIFSKKNRGLSRRLARDLVTTSQDLAGDGRDPERAKAQLEKKAKLYEKIRRGKTAGLSEAKIAELLVDFDKDPDGSEGSGSEESSEEEDESLNVPVRPTEADPLVEYTDEFGRTRLVPQSEVPRSAAASNSATPELTNEKNVHYGDQVHFPVYEPSPEELIARAAAAAAAANEPLVSHYDATRENRQKGAGFYAFSGEEKTREEQMAELKRLRKETEGAREGGREGAGDREKEERRKVLERKKEEMRRRKEERARVAATGSEGQKSG